MEKADVLIVGAGVSGLIAARELEKAGVKPLILEAADVPGGRLKTDRIDGYLLDHGFQVLLTAYPEAQHYLDYRSLNLGYFAPGAEVFTAAKRFSLSDPLRNPEKILTMLFSGIGTFSDKLKMATLTKDLKKRTPEELFNDHNSTSTLEHLQTLGFSEKIIERFFRPFFAGIFLESGLNTASGMFNFVFKMFAEGQAALPEGGIQDIPKQLVSSLKETEIRYNEKVERLDMGSVITSSGEFRADDILIATAPHNLLPGLKEQEQPYHEVLCVYFSSDERLIDGQRIGLNARKDLIINNFCYPTSIHASYAPSGKHLLSISVVNIPEKSTDQIVEQVRKEWQILTGQPSESLNFLRAYRIPRALPVMDHSAYSMQWMATKVQDHIFLAGDYLLYGSLNAAMTSGRTAAQGIVHHRR